MGAEVPVPNVAGAHWSGGAKVRDDVLSAAWLSDCGDERASGSCAFAGEGATEAVDIGADGRPEGTHRDTLVQCISEHAQEAVLGQSFLGQGLLRRYGRVEQ